ncbi:unnamed protein product [Didymodactylos carnosus]|uniref:Calpain catalytic domain-containing protein n=1 Tax=Didymodactylos carnosus TaxID=1234261 RepID=A0A8S2GEV7_9BILA|nr:unnamed protein product [Didymodactylos carnosus]CAF3508101.1 unnamed protein product [Didymodactylos carnosus]
MFPVHLYPSDELPRPGDGNQGSIGDCCLIAVLNSLADRYPSFVKSIIAPQIDGSFDVQLFNPKGQRILVSIDSNFLVNENGHLMQAHGEHNPAMWMSVLEKVIIKYNYVYKICSGSGPGNVGDIGSESVAAIFTENGDSFAFSPGVFSSPQELVQAQEEALERGRGHP